MARVLRINSTIQYSLHEATESMISIVASTMDKEAADNAREFFHNAKFIGDGYEKYEMIVTDGYKADSSRITINRRLHLM
jgi:hypothetical protein